MYFQLSFIIFKFRPKYFFNDEKDNKSKNNDQKNKKEFDLEIKKK